MQAKLCTDKNILVTPIPGPSALVAAVSASGLPTNEFTFGTLINMYTLDRQIVLIAWHCNR